MPTARTSVQHALAGLIIACGAACAPDSRAVERTSSAPATAAATQPAAIADAALEPWRAELLELAFEAASSMPQNPHVKNRARAQAEIVTACFKLEQPRRALAYAQQIENWRRGTGHAEFAVYCAERGASAEARQHIDTALAVARASEHETAQAWRADEILARVAQAELLLGRGAEAERLSQVIEGPEAGLVAEARARTMDAARYDEVLRALEAPIASGQLEQVQAALGTYAELYDRFYADAERRGALESRIKASWNGLPLLVRFQVLVRLTESALVHGDTERALALVADNEALVAGAPWQAEDHVALLAELAALRHRAGDPEGARAQAERARAMFDDQRLRIVDVFRGVALRPLAEAYHVLGEREAALATYRRALEEAVVNPNSRPRTDDLVATACSLALAGLEPDPELWRQLREVRAGLGEPW
jgi:tetratricopeptide (TPR) repeat protein